MRFAPKSEQELQVMSLLEPGLYKFQVSSATDETSKSGRDMIKLVLSVWDKDGNQHNIFDYLLDAMAYKLRHFCEATGLIAKYDHGEILAADCLNRSGYMHLEIKEGEQKQDGLRYPSRNSVKDYVKHSEGKGSEMLDDDIPF